MTIVLLCRSYQSGCTILRIVEPGLLKGHFAVFTCNNLAVKSLGKAVNLGSLLIIGVRYLYKYDFSYKFQLYYKLKLFFPATTGTLMF